MATITSPIPTDSTEVFASFKKFVVAYDCSPSAEAACEPQAPIAHELRSGRCENAS